MIDFRLAASEWTPLVEIHVDAEPPATLVGLSGATERLRRDVLRAAPRHQPIVIVGETGSGKSLVARALHEQGPRASEGYAVIACHSVPDALLQLELFGTASDMSGGPAARREGLMHLPASGTVMLEGIDAMSERTRALLARCVSRPRCRVPEKAEPATNGAPRVVATCAVDAGSSPRIHSEIAAQLGAAIVHVPSLRERRADIPALAQFFAGARDGGGGRVAFSAAAMSALTAYSWPGNVQQLRTVVERLVRIAGGGEIEPDHLPVGIRPRLPRTPGARPKVPSVGEALFARVQSSGESFWSAVYPLFMKREITRADLRDLIRRAREVTRGNLDDLVRVLNMPRSDGRRFIRFLQKYDCELTG